MHRIKLKVTRAAVHALDEKKKNTRYQENCHDRLSGKMLRQVYLGDSRDYLMDLGQTRIRVSAPPSEDRAGLSQGTEPTAESRRRI